MSKPLVLLVSAFASVEFVYIERTLRTLAVFPAIGCPTKSFTCRTFCLEALYSTTQQYTNTGAACDIPAACTVVRSAGMGRKRLTVDDYTAKYRFEARIK